MTNKTKLFIPILIPPKEKIILLLWQIFFLY